VSGPSGPPGSSGAPGATTTTTTTVEHDHDKHGIGGMSLTQVAAGAVAAAASAVAASFLGVAGTVLGAAVGSVIYTLAATIFSKSVDSAAKVSRTLVIRRATAPESPGGAPASAVPDSAAGEEPGEKVVEYTTRSGKPPQPAESIWNRIRWKPLALVAGFVFVAAMAVITVTELALGHPLGDPKGSGVTVIDVGRSSPQPTPTESRTATPTGSATPTSTGGVGASPSATPGGSAPTTTPSGTSPGLQTTAPGGSATTSGAAPPSPSR
jgi:hypothetical protein